jgi:hypothetical protein
MMVDMETTTNYITVFPATNNRRGWMVATRDGANIRHVRLETASIHDPEAARAEAAKLFPGKAIYMAGDTVKPWEAAA